MLLLTLLTALVNAQGMNYRQGGSGQDNNNAVTVDSQDNIYVAGFYNAAQFTIYDSSGQAAAILTNLGFSDSYVVKYNSSGYFLWAASQGSNSYDLIQAVAVDSAGNVYLAGRYQSQLNIFNAQGTNVASLAHAGLFDSYLVKYYANGSFLWAARQNSPSYEQPFGVVTDPSNNVYICGVTQITTFTVFDSKGNAATSFTTGNSDAFVVKYYSNGSYSWLTRLDGNGQSGALGISADIQGSVYVAATINVGSLCTVYDSRGLPVKTLPNAGNDASHIIKFLNNGSFSWAARQDGTQNDDIRSIYVSQLGYVYGAGSFSSNPLTIYDGLGKNVSWIFYNGPVGSYLVKYLTNGSFSWISWQDAGANILTQCVTADSYGNVMVGGYHRATVVNIYDAFGNRKGQLIGDGSQDAFTIKYAVNGSFLWATRQCGNGNDIVYGLATDTSNSVFVAGSYSSDILAIHDYQDNNVASLALIGFEDSYLVKYGKDGQYGFVPVTSSAATTTLTTTTSQTAFFTVLVSSSTSSVFGSSVTSSQQLPGVTSTTVYPALVTSALALSVTSSLSVSSGSEVSSTNFNAIASVVPLVLQTFQPTVQVKTSSHASSQSQIVTVPQVQSISFDIVLIILGMGTLLLLLLALILCLMYRLNKRKAKVAKQMSLNSSTTTQTTQDSYPKQSRIGNFTSDAPQVITTTYGTDISKTAMATSHVLAVPMFLALQYDLHFRQLQQIARGGGGSIHMGQVLDPQSVPHYDGSQIIVKNFGKGIGQLSEGIRISFYQEISMLHLFRDQPYFATLFGYSEQPATILLKFYESGSLKQYVLGEKAITKQFRYSKRQICGMMVQLCQGFAFMHSIQFAHCDVKPDNVLLEVRYGILEPRITDFGISRLLDASTSQVKAFKLSKIKGASIAYAAPDAVMRFRQGYVEVNPEVWKAGDVYAVAILLLEVLTRKRVWTFK